MSSLGPICEDKSLIADVRNLKQFARIFFPVMALLACVGMTGYIERLLLADFSERALTGALNGFFLARVFQASCYSIIFVGQAFVGLHAGAGQQEKIGPCVWQLIWFSILSMLLVLPLGFTAQRLLFESASFETSETYYFSILCCFNFLFPLSGALSTFYVGRGKTKLILGLTIGSCVLNILFDVLLIFGWRFIPAMGATGAALGRVTSQALLCTVLLLLFLSPSNRKNYETYLWKLSPSLFWHYIRPGFIRGLGTFFALGDWVLVSRFMTLKSEVHLLVFTLGSTLFYFLNFIGDGLMQAVITMTSQHMGRKEYPLVWTSFRSGLLLLALFGLALAVPFFVFPHLVIDCFKGASFYSQLSGIFQHIDRWLWLAVLAYGMNTLSQGVIIAARDTLYLLGFYCSLWLISFVPVYIAMQWWNWPADRFWLILTGTNFMASMAFLWRASKERWRFEAWEPKLAFPKAREIIPKEHEKAAFRAERKSSLLHDHTSSKY